MESPAPSHGDGEPTLYGVVRRGINRRLILAGIAAIPVTARAAARARIGLLRWQGTAKVFAGGRAVEIGVRTEVEPFVRARSDSWLLSDGPGKRRTMLIEPHEAFIERDGKRAPMPAPMAAHEREQYAIYGYMLEQAPVIARGKGTRTLKCDGFPPATLHFDRGRLIAIDYAVADPAASAPVRERFTFDGQLRSDGIRWPQVLRIDQNDTPYFEITFSTFEAIRA